MVVLGGAAVIAAMAAFIPGGAFVVGATALVAIVGSLAAMSWTDITTDRRQRKRSRVRE
jgi:Na+/H+ antiporter NhaC